MRYATDVPPHFDTADRLMGRPGGPGDKSARPRSRPRTSAVRAGEGLGRPTVRLRRLIVRLLGRVIGGLIGGLRLAQRFADPSRILHGLLDEGILRILVEEQ